MEVLWRVTRWVWEFLRKGRRWKIRNVRGKNWKGLKTDQVCPKHAIFATETSRVQVARTSRQNTKKKILKKFSKCFSRLEVPLTRESRTEPRKSLCTPRDWTFHPRTSHQPEPRKAWKTNFFEKYSKFFSRLKHLPAKESPVSREKSLWWTCNWGMWLVLHATESPEQGKTIFEIFDNFCKNKGLSKNN